MLKSMGSKLYNSFFSMDQCEIKSQGAFMWIRNTSANHGNVLTWLKKNQLISVCDTRYHVN